MSDEEVAQLVRDEVRACQFEKDTPWLRNEIITVLQAKLGYNIQIKWKKNSSHIVVRWNHLRMIFPWVPEKDDSALGGDGWLKDQWRPDEGGDAWKDN